MLFRVLTMMMMILLYCDMTAAQKRDLALCDPGYYAEELNGNHGNSVHPCMPCSRCPPGQYQIKSCNATQDILCAACPTNTYSNRWDSLTACKPCTVCSRHRLSDACTSTEDTLCRTRCDTGYYFDTRSSRCKRCSLCPDMGGDRVYECTQHGGSKKYQCREGSVLRARTIYYYPPQDNNLSPTERENQESLQTANLATPSTELSADMTTDFSVLDEGDHHAPAVTARTGMVNLLMTTISALQTTRLMKSSRQKSASILSVTPSSAPISPLPWTTSGLRQPSMSTRRGMTVTAGEVLMVLGIIVACGLTSFVTTYVTCHFLMKRGIVKSGDATVGIARGREPVKGWLAVPRGDIVATVDDDMSIEGTSFDMI